MTKLTKPQRDYLELLSPTGERVTWKRYRPANMLVSKGLAAWHYKGQGLWILKITDAGRSALKGEG